MQDSRRKRRKARPSTESSGEETVVEYDTSDEEAEESKEVANEPQGFLSSSDEKWAAARDFVVLVVVFLVLLDLYARTHTALWWSLPTDPTDPTDPAAHPAAHPAHPAAHTHSG